MVKSKSKLLKILYVIFCVIILFPFACSSCKFNESTKFDLSQIQLNQSDTVSEDNFAVFYAYDPKQVSINELYEINNDNYVDKIVTDSVSGLDKNFDFSEIIVSNDAQASTLVNSSEEPIDYSYPNDRSFFKRCNIFVTSISPKYFGSFKFTVNVCAVSRKWIFTDKDYSSSDTAHLDGWPFVVTVPNRLYYPDQDHWIDNEILKEYFLKNCLDEDSDIYEGVENFYSLSYPSLRKIDLSVDPTKDVEFEALEQDKTNQICTFNITFHAKLNLNYKKTNSLFAYTMNDCLCKTTIKFISTFFNINDLSNEFKELMAKDFTFSSSTQRFPDTIIPSLNIHSVSAEAISDFIIDRIFDDFLELIKENYPPYKELKSDKYLPSKKEFTIDISPVNEPEKKYYDLEVYKLFKVKVITNLGSTRFYGQINNVAYINIKSVNNCKSLKDFYINQYELFSFVSMPGEDKTKVSKNRLSSILLDGSITSSTVLSKLSSLFDETPTLIRDDNRAKNYFDYSLSINNLSEFGQYVDFSRTVRVDVKIEASNNSYFLRDSTVVTFWFKYGNEKINLSSVDLNLLDQVYIFYAFDNSNCTEKEINSISELDSLNENVIKKLHSLFFDCPLSLVTNKKQIEISISKTLVVNFASPVTIKITISASSDSDFFTSKTSELDLTVQASNTAFNLSELFFPDVIAVVVPTLTDTRGSISQELIDNLDIAHLGNSCFDTITKNISEKVIEMCPNAVLNVDYQINIPINPADTYDDAHPTVVGQILPLNSKVSGSANINFKITTQQWRTLTYVDYLGTFKLFARSEYSAANKVHVYSTDKIYDFMYTCGKSSIFVNNDVYETLTCKYVDNGLNQLKEYKQGDSSTVYTLNQLVSFGILQEYAASAAALKSYLFLTIPENASLYLKYSNTEKEKGYKSLISDNIRMFGLELYGFLPYNRQTRIFNNYSSDAISASYSKKYKNGGFLQDGRYYEINTAGRIEFGRSILFCKYKDKNGKQNLHIIFSTNPDDRNVFTLGLNNIYLMDSIKEYQTPMVNEKYTYLLTII